VSFDDAFGDREPQASPSAPLAVGLIVAIEDVRQYAGWNAGPCVSNRKTHAIHFGFSRNDDPRAARPVAERISDQISQYLPRPVPDSPHRRHLRADLQVYRHVGSLRLQLVISNHLFEQEPHGNRPRFDAKAPGFNDSGVEEIANQPLCSRKRAPDGSSVLLSAGSINLGLVELLDADTDPIDRIHNIVQ